MKKQTLNEQVSRIKGMMGKIMNEQFEDTQISNPEENEDTMPSSDDIDWDWKNAHRQIMKGKVDPEGSFVRIYGTDENGQHYKGTIRVSGDDFSEDPVENIEIDTDWEPSDDDMMNQGNYEGGISHGSGDSWQGR